SGHIYIGDRDVTRLKPHERDIGLLGQRPALYPQLNVRRNLSIGLEVAPKQDASSAEIEKRAPAAPDCLGLCSVADRLHEKLSGGEQQRVALGRLMVRRPSVWLLDEPLNHLDSGRKNEFCRHLHLLREQFPTTILFVTHDPVEALTLGQRLAVM